MNKGVKVYVDVEPLGVRAARVDSGKLKVAIIIPNKRNPP